MSSAIWQILYELFIFCGFKTKQKYEKPVQYLLIMHELLCDAITSLSLASTNMQRMRLQINGIHWFQDKICDQIYFDAITFNI